MFSHNSVASIEKVDKALAASTANSDVLRLKGLLVAEVSVVSSTRDEAVVQTIDNLIAWLKSIQDLARECNGGAPTLARTLVGDTNNLMQRSSRGQYLKAYKEMCSMLQRRESPGRLGVLAQVKARLETYEYWTNCIAASHSRRIIRTSDRNLGTHFLLHKLRLIQLTIDRPRTRHNQARRYHSDARRQSLPVRSANRWRLLPFSW